MSTWTAMTVRTIALAGMLVAWAILPGPSGAAADITHPTPEILAQFDFDPPMWGMPDATTWDWMEACFLQVGPGQSFTTDVGWFTDVDGPLLITVFSGELSVVPAGPALFYAAGQPHHPEAVSPGQTVSLESGETIVYSAADAADASNPGSEPVHGIYGLMGVMIPDTPGMDALPSGVLLSSIYGYDDVQPLPAGGASVSIQRLQLAAYDSYVFIPDPAFRTMVQTDVSSNTSLRVVEGAVEGIAPGIRGQSYYGPDQFRHPVDPGPMTIVNLGEATVDFYVLTIEPYPSEATPTS